MFDVSLCLTSLLISYLNLKNLPFGSEQFFLGVFLFVCFDKSSLSLFWSTINLKEDFIDWILNSYSFYFLLLFF